MENIRASTGFEPVTSGAMLYQLSYEATDWLTICGFIAQSVEHCTGIAEVPGSNPVEALIFSGFFFPIDEIRKCTARIILLFHLQPQFKYESFHVYFASFHSSREI